MPRRETLTGGRAATNGVIPGRWALSVGQPEKGPPSGFSWIKLTEVARLESGHTPSRAVADYWNGDIPWIGIRDATQNHGKVIYTTEQLVTPAGIDNSSARVLPSRTVCLSRTASVGFVVSMGVPMATSQDFVNWVCGPKLNPKYLHYLLMLEQQSIRRFAQGTTHQTVYYPEAKAFHVCIPSRRDQDAVVHVLGALDDKIAANERAASVIDELTASMLDEALDRPGVSEVRLADVARVNARQTKPVIDGFLRYIDISSVSTGRLDRPGRIPWSIAPGRARRGLQPGDTIWSTVRPGRRSYALILDSDPELVASTGFAVLTPEVVGPAFLYEVTKRDEFVQYLESVAEGSAYPAVRAERFSQALIRIPPRSSLQRFEACAFQFRQRAESAQQESRALTELRDALLPRLMSGEIRVREAEKVVEDAT